MAMAASSSPRVVVDGKFFRLGGKKFYVKGITYGPFAPNAAGQPFASVEQTAKDFEQIRQLGANLVRVYNVPGRWLLDLAAQHDLKVLVDVTWNKHLCFLDSEEYRAAAFDAVRRAAFGCARHPALFALNLANEIPPDIVRWSGAKRVADFIDDLAEEARRVDDGCLCTFTNYPSTEFLRPQNLDFICFNVYLHQEQPFRNYLARLQMLAEARPLVLGEFGIDSLREGEDQKCRMLGWQIEDTFRAGLAGAIVFSFTDEWFKDGREITDWHMGLTTRERQPKPSFDLVRKKFEPAPWFHPARWPKVSVIVACFNGERTLKLCLESLVRLNYPDYEIILVDDGSTDSTPQIARTYPSVRYLRHNENLGLSTARNTGIAAATSEVVAYTDADCRADEDWLYYLVVELLDDQYAGVGGPNFLPPEDSPVAAAVMASPGGPAPVMLTDRQAEHIPGCNMAFYKWVLEDLGGFDPVFHAAGDDVDLCWRLEQAGQKIGFSPAAFVWHYRRSTVRDYLAQQRGYGEAEALLVRKHPEYFNSLGASLWRGRIYTHAKFGVLLRPPIIYRGRFGMAGFQTLYASQPAFTLMLCTSLEYHVMITLPLWVLSAPFHHLLPLAITSLCTSLGVCAAAGAQASLPRNRTFWWSRPLVAALFFLQPVVRGWARYQNRLALRKTPAAPQPNLDSLALLHSKQSLREVAYWTSVPVQRLDWLREIVRRLDETGWPNKSDLDWSDYDLELYGRRWTHLQLITVAEEHPQNRQLLRARLQGRWSLRAKLTFALLCALVLLVVGFVGPGRVWPWFLLLLLPAYGWFLQREIRELQSMAVVFLDQLARDWKMVAMEG